MSGLAGWTCRASGPALLLAVGILLSGCEGQRPSSSSGHGAGGRSEAEPAGRRILGDVIAATYPVPGAGVRHGMRVHAFLQGIGLKECGVEPRPVDSTADRVSQDLYPDLALIRKRGLAEFDEDPRDHLSPDCVELAPDSITSWAAWFRLGAEWQDLAYRVREQSEDVRAQRQPMAECLRRRTGLPVPDLEPTSFLAEVNDADASGITEHQYLQFSRAYADCGQRYFSSIRVELEKERPVFVDRNLAILQRLADEIVAAGYLP